MKMNKKITSAVLALAMITSSFSGILPIGGKLQASAAFDTSMSADHTPIFTPSTQVAGGMITFDSIKESPIPNNPNLYVEVLGTVNDAAVTSAENLEITVLKQPGNVNVGGVYQQAVEWDNDAGHGEVTTATKVIRINVLAALANQIKGENTLEMKIVSADPTTQGNPAILKFNVKDGKLLLPKPKLPTTIHPKTVQLSDKLGTLNNNVLSLTTRDLASVRYTQSVGTPAPTGAITFTAGATPLPAGVTISAGGTGLDIDLATFSANSDIRLNASYAGDANYVAVSNQDTTFRINKAKPTMTVQVNTSVLDNVGYSNDGLPYTATVSNRFAINNTTPTITAQILNSTGNLDRVTVDTANNKISWYKLTDETGGAGTFDFVLDVAGDNANEAISVTSNISVNLRPKADLKADSTITEQNDAKADKTVDLVKVANITEDAKGGNLSYLIKSQNLTANGAAATATLNNANLTLPANSEGNVVVTVKQAEGNEVLGAEKDITINVVGLPPQVVEFVNAPSEVTYDGSNTTTVVAKVKEPATGGGAVTYSLENVNPTGIATIDANTGVITWTGYGSVDVKATAVSTTTHAETKVSHSITRKKADLTVQAKTSAFGMGGPKSVSDIVTITGLQGSDAKDILGTNVTYKLSTDTAAEMPIDFSKKDYLEGEYDFTFTPATSLANYNDITTPVKGKFTVRKSSGSSDDNQYLTVFYDLGENGSITSGASNEQVVKGGKPKHVPTVKAINGFEHTGWSLDGKQVDPTSVTINSNTTFKAIYNGEIGKPTTPEVPSDLKFNKDLTEPYIKGDAGGAFRPDDSITRGEFATIISRVLNKKMDENQSGETVFKDISSDDWYAKSIAFVQSIGLINGYEDGTFRPDDSITRAEAAVIIMRVERTEGETITGTLTDISGNWAEKEILAAYANGFISGYPDGTFRPDASITRAETVVLMNNVLGVKPIEAENVFIDIDGHWAAPHITAAAKISAPK